MERVDSNPSIEELVQAHEQRREQNISLNDHDEETPKPSGFVYQQPEYPLPDTTQDAPSAPKAPSIHTTTSSFAAQSNTSLTSPEDVKSETIAPSDARSSKTTPLPSRTPSAKASLQSVPLGAAGAGGSGTNITQRMFSSASALHLPTSPSQQQLSGTEELVKFTLYETKRRFYIIGSNSSDTMHRVLKVDRTSQEELSLDEDKTPYDNKQLSQLLRMLDDGNRATGGFTRSGIFYGIAGFVRFTAGWYLVAISKRTVVALLGGHYIYHCEDTQMYQVTYNQKVERPSEEQRLMAAFRQVDMSRNFYFATGYDITSSLQANLTSHPYSPSTQSTNKSASPIPSRPPLSPHPHRSSLHTDTKEVSEKSASQNSGSNSQPNSHSNSTGSTTTGIPNINSNNNLSVPHITSGSSSKPMAAAQSQSKLKSTPKDWCWKFNDHFAWNHHMLADAFGPNRHVPEDDGAGGGGTAAEPISDCWILPMIYGHVDQAKLNVLGRVVYVTLIARRSRHYAGARYLKRGANEEGKVANEVETEQIVTEAATTAFYSPASRLERETTGGGRVPNARYTSYVQYRGSIPVYWTQETSQMTPKPPIEVTIMDPYYSAAARHFDDLFKRYSAPVIILNLIKSREPVPRESKLLKEYTKCIDYLNQFLPADKKLIYHPWDMSKAYKEKKKDVIGVLEDMAEECINLTGLFHTGPEPYSHYLRAEVDGIPYRSSISLQNGIVRTNCIDCLDRTNAAQFVFGKKALGHQLYALGIISEPHLGFDSDAVNMLTQMWHDHGDTIALQYTGSALVNRVETYRRMPHWNSHSRDMIENIRRFYANSMLDADKQAAINIFLGVEETHGRPNRQRPLTPPPGRTYQEWYDPRNLEPAYVVEDCERRLREFAIAGSEGGKRVEGGSPNLQQGGDYWNEYYRPALFTSLGKHFAYRMNSTEKLPGNHAKEIDRSPLQPNIDPSKQHPKIMDGVRRWIGSGQNGARKASERGSKHKDHLGRGETQAKPRPDVDPNSIEAFIQNLLSPTVNEDEQPEYEKYVGQNYSMATSSESTADHDDHKLYVAGVSLAQGFVPETMYHDSPEKKYREYMHRGTAAGMLGEPLPDPPSPVGSPVPSTQTLLPHGGAGAGGATSEREAPPFSYERWIASGTTRKVTGDFLLGHHTTHTVAGV